MGNNKLGANQVFIGLGSNLGDPPRELELGLRQLERDPGVRVQRCSRIYRTQPVGPVNQPDFANQVVELYTHHAAPQLLALVLEVERAAGRVRLTPQGPRILDIDLLLYGNSILKTENLTLPHPRMLERCFVLVPLAELAPALLHPMTGQSMQEHLEQAPKDQCVTLWAESALVKPKDACL